MNDVFPLRDLKGALWPRKGAAVSPSKRRPSEGDLADEFAHRNQREVGYLAATKGRKGGWIVWSNGEWQIDRTNTALRLARAVCAEAASKCANPALDSYRAATAVLSLAKCDLRIAVTDWPCNPDIIDAIEAWLAGPVEVNPEGFLSLADLHKTLPEACEWDRGEADAALEACGIAYRRKGNVHGFDGVRLREADDVQ